MKNGLQWIWPSIVDIATAQKAAKQGAWAAVFVAAVTTVFSTIGQLNNNFMGFDAWSYLDAVLFAIIAFGIFKYSRTAAILGLLLYLLERAVMWAEHGARNPFMAFLFIMLFISSIRGTFEYHKRKNNFDLSKTEIAQ